MQPGELAHAHRLLLIPDLLHSWLCGALVDRAHQRHYDAVLGSRRRSMGDRICLNQLEIPTSMLPPVVEAGTVLGEVLPEWREELGAAHVISSCHPRYRIRHRCNPCRDPVGGWGYISSGTWSLVGVELQQPVMTPEAALDANCTNEGGVFGTTRFLKNVMGLWLLQECQRSWQRDGHTTDYDTLLADVDGCPAICRPD